MSARMVIRLGRVKGDKRGVAVTEFGLIAPVFILFIMVVFDLGHMAYARSVLEGAVEKAARSASLEGGDPAQVDQMIENLIRPVLPGVALETQRFSYFDVGDIDRPEKFNDTNDNDVCDNGESFVDENGSEKWEPDIGVAGNGGSNDVVVYDVTATYTPIFKIPFLPGAWNERKLHATTVKTNQPFGNQQKLSTTAGTCEDD